MIIQLILIEYWINLIDNNSTIVIWLLDYNWIDRIGDNSTSVIWLLYNSFIHRMNGNSTDVIELDKKPKCWPNLNTFSSFYQKKIEKNWQKKILTKFDL